jgi:hypothetical protein
MVILQYHLYFESLKFLCILLKYMKKENTNASSYILIGVLFIIFLSFWTVIMIFLRQNPQNSTYYLTCDPGKCPINLYNGEKRCPPDTGTSLIYDPAFETCSSEYVCDNNLLPYAITSDGSTNLLGVCDPGIACRCIKDSICSYDNLVKFTLTDAEGGGQYYKQTSLPSQGYIGTPLNITKPETEFCQIKFTSIDTVVPRTSKCTFQVPGNPSYSEAVLCFYSNPCTIGQLTFKPGNSLIPFSFTSSNYLNTMYSIPVGCSVDIHLNSDIYYDSVNNNCLFGSDSNGHIVDGSVPVWDSTINKIVCKK